MYSKNNKKMNDQKQLEKVNQYGIKKFNVGTASVLVAAGFAFLGGGNALASNDTAVTNANEPASETAATTPSKEETPAPTVAKANKANLSAAIARVQNAIAKATVTEKTASAIEEGKAELANAQALEASETATQGEVDKATVALKNRAFVLESMPKAKAEPKETSEAKPKAEVKEEKVNKNQDPRNGQAIPGQGESGFRASSYVVGSDNQPNVPTAANTGKSKLTFEAPTPEKIEAIKEGLKKNTVQPTNLDVNNVTAVGGGGASNVIVQGTGGTPTTLELEILSNQHVGEETNPPGIGSNMRKGRLDYPLSPENVKKLEAEAPLWNGKLKPDGNKVSTNAGEQYGNTGGYEFLATEIYKLGYEQGVDRVYIPNIKQRIALTEAAKAAGWEVKSITPTNLPPGLIYDEKTDTIQGRVVANVQNGVYDFRLAVDAENKTTNQTAKVTLADLRVG